MGKPTQVIKVNKSILDYFKRSMDFDNKSEAYRTITEKEFKNELHKALDSATLATIETRWVD